MAIDSYTGLSAAVQAWAERDYDQTQIDEFIALAEAAFNRRLAGYQREVTTTLTTDASGEVALPSDFIRFVSVTDASGNPLDYAISGSTFSVRSTPHYSATLNVTYAAGLEPLSANNETNWLLDTAPDAYLWMVKAQQRAFEESWEVAAGMEAKANAILRELSIQSQASQYGRVGLSMSVAP